MPYARIISTEFKSEEDLEVAVIAWKKLVSRQYARFAKQAYRTNR